MPKLLFLNLTLTKLTVGVLVVMSAGTAPTAVAVDLPVASGF